MTEYVPVPAETLQQIFAAHPRIAVRNYGAQLLRIDEEADGTQFLVVGVAPKYLDDTRNIILDVGYIMRTEVNELLGGVRGSGISVKVEALSQVA